MHLVLVELYHSFLKSIQFVAVSHAKFSVFVQSRTTAAGTFDGLNDHPGIVFHFHPLSPEGRAWGSWDLTFFHCTKLLLPVNQNRNRSANQQTALEYLSDCAHPRYGEVSVTPQQYGGIFYPKVV